MFFRGWWARLNATIYILGSIMYFGARLFLDLTLLISYIRGLLSFNYYLSRIDAVSSVNPMQHEQLLIITRYFVVFGVSILMDFLMILSLIIADYIQYGYPNLVEWKWASIIDNIFFMMDIATYMIAGYCCFEFSYNQYTKLCCLCHCCMYRLCERISIFQYHRKWDTFLENNKEWKISMDKNHYVLLNDCQ